MTRLGISLLFVIVALVLQRPIGWDEGLALGATDATNYEAIALAAPGFPAEKLRFHRAQRWAAPYVLGVIARTLGIEVRTAFYLATGVSLAAAMIFMHLCLARMGLSPGVFATAMALLVFHFSLRFYLVAPGMLPDALFIASLTGVLYGLASGRAGVLLGALLVAALARQTALLLVPGIACTLIAGEAWQSRTRLFKAELVVATTMLCVLAYLVTGEVAARFAEPSENMVAIKGLFSWIASDVYLPAELLRFAAYTVFPLLIPGTLAIAALPGSATGSRGGWVSSGFAGNLLLVLGIVCQPLLGGPAWIGDGNALRLSALALAPAVLPVAWLLERRAPRYRGWKGCWLTPALLAVASLHYHYTWFGPPSASAMIAWHMTIAALLAALSLLDRPAGSS